VRIDNIARHAENILKQSERMVEMANAMQAYTRQQVDLEPMDLNNLLSETIESFKTDARFTGVNWNVDLDPKLPQINGDVSQIHNVLLNLIVNAADAMSGQDTPRTIVVTTELRDHSRSAQVSISDTGPGIKPENLKRMFEFAFTTKKEGHGFGLSTAHLAIERHGGTMTVESPPGSGATFTIVLPVGGPGGAR
jgi:signal transduction histidine kinase